MGWTVQKEGNEKEKTGKIGTYAYATSPPDAAIPSRNLPGAYPDHQLVALLPLPQTTERQFRVHQPRGALGENENFKET